MYGSPVEAEVWAGVPAPSGGGATHLLTIEEVDGLPVPALGQVEAHEEPNGESEDRRHQGGQGQGLLGVDRGGVRSSGGGGV